ncbi:hypothetical protein S7711_09507 [Stachybotrys chartarum IBT 7711]|uniref:Carrier domain-containing protein n=1 Tax=Stachybotrys chartarum (strain CBS 109288 / IBT 7711) TaxID=1280523 RepID=A0A084B5F9_STACB|nr:hypothetical protein S7711_09507 [Stachybotrys chartarum IBT 7711]
MAGAEATLVERPSQRLDLVPHIIDRLAVENPKKVYGLWPVAPFSYDAGFRTVTYGDLANAVNGLAWWLDKQLGPSETSEVLTYVGPNDVRYSALTLAAIKTGYVVFVTSPRNSATAHAALFDSLKCKILLTTDPTPPPAAAVIQAVQPRTLNLPSINQLFGEAHPVYVYKKTLNEARNDPFVIIHTSGSTGLPKPLVWTVESSLRQHAISRLDAPEGVQSIESFSRRKRIMVTLPPFHGAGITQYLFHPFSLDTVAVAPAATGIVTGQGLVEALKQTPAEIALLVPSVVVELAQDPELLEYCAKHLKLIVYIGGDLPQRLGDLVASKVPLRCQWGASEVGIPQQLMPSNLGPADWRYVQFHPAVGARFEEVSEDLFELVIPYREELKDTQPSFGIRGQEGLKEYRTRDYFAKHPRVPDAWCWRARTDDIIVFLNGEKTNPISFEHQIVAKNPELRGALVTGSQRFQAGLLIEPVGNLQSTAEQAALIERVWPTVDEANHQAPAHARVEKPFIRVIASDRPMIRSGKGTVQRAATLALYASDIDTLYADAESLTVRDEPEILARDRDSITSFVRNAVLAATKWPALDDAERFFDRGLDSLQALGITRALRRALRQPTLGLSTIYKNPTIKELSAVILGYYDDSDNEEYMASLLSTYVGLVKQIPVSRGPTPDRPADVLLTGSTGYLGTYMLHALLTRPGIGQVFCLNRSADGGRSIQFSRFVAAGLSTNEIARRVIFLNADLAHPALGLDDDTYKMVCARTGLIIHNAWPVNFVLDLNAFRPQLSGIVNLCVLSAEAPQPAQILFISTIGAAGQSLNGKGAPEAILESLSTPHPNGYSQSKFLSEIILSKAAENLKIPVKIARVGQVAGPAHHGGIWNPKEWLPSLVGSSISLGCLPDNIGPQFTEVDWIPSDTLAEVVVDIGTSESIVGAEVFNLRNPKTTTWSELVPTIREAYQELSGKELEVVAPSTWLERLQQSIESLTHGDVSLLTAAAEQNPGIRLHEFYRDSLWTTQSTTPPMVIDHAMETSPSLRELPAIKPSWMRKWLQGWGDYAMRLHAH